MKMFSNREEKIVKFLNRSKRKTLNEIALKVWEKGDKPFENHIAIGNSVRRIIKKCEYHNLDWTLVKIREDGKLYIKKEKKG